MARLTENLQDVLSNVTPENFTFSSASPERSLRKQGNRIYEQISTCSKLVLGGNMSLNHPRQFKNITTFGFLRLFNGSRICFYSHYLFS